MVDCVESKTRLGKLLLASFMKLKTLIRVGSPDLGVLPLDTQLGEDLQIPPPLLLFFPSVETCLHLERFVCK